ncbi:YcgN family cysteine cluster protein [Gallaecimonas mangrovi]|uniref:YcgN family cysteine cluster protein n=1 Tax=Gallaecimonas mangrovi TaxID=2291597 RepID=UPI000E2047C8|nr:YcgN family cysteine cluster protein [Gallaecimonas mangrovi]
MTINAFWEQKSLKQMTRSEWESLCDGCGKCCLHKLQDEDTDEVYHTAVACQLLDLRSGGCSDYANRFAKVDDCLQLDADNLDTFQWLPPSCAYRRLSEGKGLPSWHPLLNDGKKHKMHAAGMSVRHKAVSEGFDLDPADFIVIWPLDEVE